MLIPHINHASLVGGSWNRSHPDRWSIGKTGTRKMILKSPANLRLQQGSFANKPAEGVPKHELHICSIFVSDPHFEKDNVYRIQ